MERVIYLARNRRIYIGLLVLAVAFFFIGNLGGKKGNPAWLLTPVCLAVMVVLGIVAFVSSRRVQPGPR